MVRFSLTFFEFVAILSRMKTLFLKKLKESAISILPISVITIILTAIFVPNSLWSIVCLGIAIVLLMIGISLFSMGNEMSLMKIGGLIGSHVSKTKKIFIMLLCSFLIGTLVTIAESDLSILASQIPGINSWLFIIVVGISVGFCMLLATLRIILNIKIQYVLAIAYLIILVLMFFTPKAFLPISFDASGVTTGAISVPFIMSFGLGISAVRSGESNQDDSFGMIAMCSIGPIFAVMLMSVILKNAGAALPDVANVDYTGIGTVFGQIGFQFLENMKDVALILTPILLLFVIYNFVALKLPKQTLGRILIGSIYTYVGITFFFVGAKSGFLPVASKLAVNIFNYNPVILIPIIAIVGLFIVVAEPAIHVLNKQVEDLSSGSISKRKMLLVLSVGVALSVTLAVLRIIFKIDILYILTPLVALMIILSFFSPSKITAIAFDSGGTAAGIISSTFVIPFMQGICFANELDLMTFGFGTIGIIITVPIIVVEIMGIKIRVEKERLARLSKIADQNQSAIKIIEFD